MLTFTFTGVDGSMTESELLTSGMVGKEIQLLFDDSWAALTKTVVFRAGDTCRVVTEASSPVTIPEDVLARPFGKLYVGVYGTDAEGTLVIPTIMAEGPLIRYGADPIEDETAMELPVWQNLQNQIGDLTALETEEKENLTAAVNELHSAQKELASDIRDLQEGQACIGDPAQLETEERSTLVAAVNEVHSQLDQLMADCVGLSPAAAQLLVDILSRSIYSSDQSDNVDALAAELGVSVSPDPVKLLHHWDFRSGSLTDLIGGLEAIVSEDVTLDSAGAHSPSKTSYIMFPLGADGTSPAGNVVEVKFGEMSLDEAATSMRLLTICTGTQPATAGLQWSFQDCWTRSASVITDFTELNMFSGKALIIKTGPEGTQLDWYLEDQLITSVTSSYTPTHMSVGSSVGSAFPLTVEYIKIYPDA